MRSPEFLEKRVQSRAVHGSSTSFSSSSSSSWSQSSLPSINIVDQYFKRFSFQCLMLLLCVLMFSSNLVLSSLINDSQQNQILHSSSSSSSSLSSSLKSSNSFKRSVTEDYAKAFDHGARVRTEGACRKPHPMIIYVNKTDPSKVHLPRGTVLHRCSDLTGCCQNPSESCVAIEMQTVELYFITITLQVQSPHKNRRVRQSPKIEKILFTNHTLCGCRTRSDDVDFQENEI